jgi:two-component system sensor histidine kinase DegS
MREIKQNIADKEFINSINNSVPIIIFIFSIPEQRISFINDQLFALLGYLPEEMCNTPVMELKKYIVDYEKYGNQTPLTGITTDNNYFEATLKIKHKNSGLKWLNLKYTKFKTDEKGDILELICSATDVTQQKQNERKINGMMRLNDLNDRRVRKVRTLSLIQGQEEERRRISRDIHDGIGQMLTALKLNIEHFDETGHKNEDKKTQLNLLKTIIRDTISEVRRVANALSPPGLYDFGLYSVTKQLLDQIAKTSAINIHFDHNIQNVRYLPFIEATLYRIIQESTNNVLKHSKANFFELSLFQDENNLKLVMCDDGIGFNYSENKMNVGRSNGNGIRNIRDRAITIGAELTIISSPGNGCFIKINIPIANCQIKIS